MLQQDRNVPTLNLPRIEQSGRNLCLTQSTLAEEEPLNTEATTLVFEEILPLGTEEVITLLNGETQLAMRKTPVASEEVPTAVGEMPMARVFPSLVETEEVLTDTTMMPNEVPANQGPLERMAAKVLAPHEVQELEKEMSDLVNGGPQKRASAVPPWQVSGAASMPSARPSAIPAPREVKAPVEVPVTTPRAFTAIAHDAPKGSPVQSPREQPPLRHQAVNFSVPVQTAKMLTPPGSPLQSWQPGRTKPNAFAAVAAHGADGTSRASPVQSPREQPPAPHRAVNFSVPVQTVKMLTPPGSPLQPWLLGRTMSNVFAAVAHGADGTSRASPVQSPREQHLAPLQGSIISVPAPPVKIPSRPGSPPQPWHAPGACYLPRGTSIVAMPRPASGPIAPASAHISPRTRLSPRQVSPVQRVSVVHANAPVTAPLASQAAARMQRRSSPVWVASAARATLGPAVSMPAQDHRRVHEQRAFSPPVVVNRPRASSPQQAAQTAWSTPGGFQPCISPRQTMTSMAAAGYAAFRQQQATGGYAA
eukprot:TRINITY_DN6487_c0_g1_i1.p1 TRINITY_DN6487_c0_g1~~TRINITY_DN6487_c0_g1_i1.p1  ORF type:complete len:534 (+),score=85.65 TRINITY_DN6487_c0_g1_i1:124-1725(+)